MTMSCWGELISPGEPLNQLVPWGGLTPVQQRLLERISPIQAPVLGFETRRRQRWRQADLALLVLSQQWKQWARLLTPALSSTEELGADLPIAALSGFLQLEQCRPETWLEVCSDLNPSQMPGLMLFKNPLQPLALKEARDLCLSFALQQKTSALGLPLAIIDDCWWTAVEAAGLAQVHQIGINLRERPIQWRLLLGAIAGSRQHLRAFKLPQSWHSELEQWPHHLALIGGGGLEACGLEILPKYRSQQTLADLQSAPPTGCEQWPSLLRQSGMLTAARHRQLNELAAATSWAFNNGSPLTLLSGVNHLKIPLAQGEPLDLKVYAGAFARSRAASRADPQHDLRAALLEHWQRHQKDPWQGFQLNPGSSDRWITAAVLTLLANEDGAGSAAWLQRLWQQRCEQLVSNLKPLQPIGYNKHTPADADSSIWLQRLLIASGRPADVGLNRFIAAHWSRDGISTYRPQSGIAAFINRDAMQTKGWLMAHDCVLANLSALSGPLQNGALSLLRRRVQSGAFRSYWWPAAGWALALAPRGSLPLQAVVDLVEQPLTPSVSRCLGSARSAKLWEFQRAVALLRHGHSALQLQSCQTILQLLHNQGNLAQLACLQIPDPSLEPDTTDAAWDLDTGLEGSLNLDQQGHFSAALVQAALETRCH